MKFKITKYYAAVLVFIIIPYFIDQIDGFASYVLHQELPISKIYKTPVLLYAMGYTIAYDKTRKYATMLIGFLFLIIMSTLVNIHDLYTTPSEISSDFGYLIKIFTFPILYFYFTVFHRNNPFPDDTFVRKIFLFLFGSFAVAMVLSNFGFGIPFYGTNEEGESIGQQGYFGSGNEISALFLLLTCVFYYYMFMKNSMPAMFAGLITGLGVGALMGSKTAIGSSLICFVATYFLFKIYEKKIFKINKVDAGLIFSIVGIAFLGVVFLDQIMDFLSPLIARTRYRWRVSGEDVVRFLTSGRLIRAEAVLDNFANHLPYSHMFFGVGYSNSKRFDIPNYRFPSAEMDFVDIMTISGLVGVLMIYAFWIYIWLRVFKFFLHRKTQFSIPLVVALGILTVNSNISGHIIYSGVLNPSLAYLSMYVLKRNKQEDTGPPLFQNLKSSFA